MATPFLTSVVVILITLRQNSHNATQSMFVVNIGKVPMIGREDERLGVLIVDDESGVRTLFKAMLESKLAQATFYFAGDGVEAFQKIPEILANQDQVLVLTDVMMPGEGADGIDLLRNIRTSDDEQIKNLPVIMITASAGAEVNIPKEIQRRTDAEVKYDALVTKPVRMQELITVVQGVLGTN